MAEGLELKRTNRGFAIVNFIDKYSQQCSLQKSSLVEPCVWLGVEVDMHGHEVMARMHLTQDMCLIYFLTL